MKKFALTANFTGVVFVYYSAADTLLDLQTSQAELSVPQVNRLFKNIPVMLIDLVDFCNATGLKVVEVVEEVTFEQFYTAYGYKEGRKKAEATWSKMSDAERVKAYLYIRTLKNKKKISGEALPYPATYLNQARWND